MNPMQQALRQAAQYAQLQSLADDLAVGFACGSMDSETIAGIAAVFPGAAVFR